jgi:uncharacterized phiE125 gp8 family phage protein
MPSILTTPPIAEPLALAEAKAHLRVTSGAEDGLIGALIAAARRHVETATGLALLTQGWSLVLDRWPATPEIALPRWPLIALASLKVYGDDDVAAVIDPSHYFADGVSRPARLVRRGSRAWAPPGRIANGIEIAASYGFGAAGASVPEPLKQAMLRLIAHWFESRGDAAAPPLDVAALIGPYRAVPL